MVMGTEGGKKSACKKPGSVVTGPSLKQKSFTISPLKEVEKAPDKLVYTNLTTRIEYFVEPGMVLQTMMKFQ